jgi:hypothetical protein
MDRISACIIIGVRSFAVNASREYFVIPRRSAGLRCGKKPSKNRGKMSL